MGNKLHWEKWYHGDWLRESAVARCSLAARGLWIELLSLMFQEGVSMISGSPEELSRMARCNRDELVAALEELGRTMVADVTLGNDFVTVTCRRLEKQRKTRELTARRVSRHRQKRPSNAAVTGEKTEDRRQNTEDRIQKTEDRIQKTEDRIQKTENTPQCPLTGRLQDDPSDDWVLPAGWDRPEVRKALDDFAAMRKRIRKPVSSKVSTSKIFKRFDSPQHLIEVAEICEANNWQGLDPVYSKPRMAGQLRSSAASKVDGTIQAMRHFAGGST